MKKSIFLLCLLLCLSLLLSSCGHYLPPDNLFDSFSQRYPLPPGKVFRTSAAEGEEGHLSLATFRQIYARPDGSDDFEDIEECTLWHGISMYAVYEMGIFLCRDGDSARSVYLMCQNRLRFLKSFQSYANTEAVESAVIYLSGRMVVFLVLPDNATAQRIIDRLL